MISCLHLHHFVTFESTLIDFRSGFTVITGETGAGKSLILQALAIVLGKSFPNGCVRQPAKKAELQAVFDLSGKTKALEWLNQKEIPCEDPTQVIIRREFDDANRHRSWINGQLTPLKNLVEFGELLLHFSPQHLQTKISSGDYQRTLFDEFCGCAALSQGIQKRIETIRFLQKELNSLQLDEQTFLQRRDFLTHQKADIDQLNLEEFSFEGLMDARDQLKRQKVELEVVQKSIDLLDGNLGQTGILEGLGMLQRHLMNHPLPEDLLPENTTDALSDAETLLSKISHACALQQSALEPNTDEHETIEAQITLFKRMERKYGYGEAALREKYVEICDELNRLGSLEKQIQITETKIQQETKCAVEECKKLEVLREQMRPAFEQKITDAMKSLDIPKADFHTTFKKSIFNEKIPVSEPLFLFDANGKEPVPFNQRASGGELARMALSLSSVAHETSATGICLFDEIDTGMSGNTLHTLGQYLSKMGNKTQVLLVTHQAIVASLANHHAFVSKCHKRKATVSDCKELDQHAREQEISRLLDGQQSSRSLDVARDLMQPKAQR
ncbi:MAG: AAA family ATPase [Sumerlaeia bacterium]